MRFAIGIEYDGSGFNGWQSQPGGGTVQDAVETAIQYIAGVKIRVNAAGRTDSGVHAVNQVAHFDVEVKRPLNAWVRGVNGFLPPGVAVTWVKEVEPAFHARRCARQRTYRYVLLNHPVRPAFFQGHVGWYHIPVDVERMQEASACLMGQHDFSAFRAAGCQSASPVRNISSIKIVRQADYVLFELKADAFLYHMVRNIVGCLVYIGDARREIDWMVEVLESRSRKLAAPTINASGLYLFDVEYDPKWSLPHIGGRFPFGEWDLNHG
ncbi:MAG: tRNA pseudouridine(38-40) synthase TruA [Proteobacteria bacterium]|nr:tRNA pseudouridine(38-40) synthase TruA [Pseudomonadota bacterium]MDE3207305.1 tRNA pseudouridine(38-40) synthase TruA [Pseudomonadota bacterium]